MGANAQTSVPSFTAGEVLSAANMNLSARTGVPVFADSTARDAGFGGTGEKVLAEGQLCYLESTNVVQYYDGSVWATVGPATSSALVYITGATFTTSAAVTFANDTFTSTYNNYLVVMNFGSSNSSTTLGLQYRDNVGTKSTANYYSGTSGYRYNAAAANRNTNAGTSATLFGMGGSGSNATENVMFMVSNPTSATSNTVCTFYFYTDDAGGAGGCRYAVLEAHTGLVLTPSAGTITGTYRVYGIVNS